MHNTMYGRNIFFLLSAALQYIWDNGHIYVLIIGSVTSLWTLMSVCWWSVGRWHFLAPIGTPSRSVVCSIKKSENVKWNPTLPSPNSPPIFTHIYMCEYKITGFANDKKLREKNWIHITLIYYNCTITLYELYTKRAISLKVLLKKWVNLDNILNNAFNYAIMHVYELIIKNSCVCVCVPSYL